MRKALFLSTKILASALLIMPLPSHAWAQSVEFSSNVAGGCALNVLNDGTLGVSGDKLQLSSKLLDGTAGTVRVTSNANFFMSAIAPTLWSSSPIVGNGDTNFQALFSGDNVSGNGRTFAERDGANDINTRGGGPRVTDLTIHLIADSTAGAFPIGNYSANVTVLCE